MDTILRTMLHTISQTMLLNFSTVPQEMDMMLSYLPSLSKTTFERSSLIPSCHALCRTRLRARNAAHDGEHLRQSSTIFSCPSSSMPTFDIYWPMVLDLEPSRPNQTKPTRPTYLTYFPGPPELPRSLTYPPTWPTHPSVLTTYLIYPPIQITSQNRQITSLSPQITFHSTDSTILTKFHNLDKI